ncbi:hypothetical protein PN497_20330 [Sphaerospermopsis kisseleviana CS-549]|uniref:Transposase n=1 Tax=Sphaerospermopsis kisseleviana CS-549 TaxID=3021783 RepID=A0ABT4ZX73_9CYAN|nr:MULTISPECIES: hypothetical protein [Sphaerospermopsis]MBD2132578.1 hypothetical protein [Sphaerospermopsis sp. FACHB-1094]MDB9443681.1 hypothetical protein [Sphaerospermopsis kisseleviana CS-549]
MTSSKKSNRDHAKKKQRPMVEDEVIAEQLERLLTSKPKSFSPKSDR